MSAETATLAERLARGHATSFEQQLVRADGSLLAAIVADTVPVAPRNE